MRKALQIVLIVLGLMAFTEVSVVPAHGRENPEMQRTRKKKNTGNQTKKKTNSKQTSSKATSGSKPKTSSEAKKKQQEAQKEIKLTEEQIKENEAKVKKSLNELGKLDQDIDATNKSINALNQKLNVLSSQINSLESDISSNEAELERLRSEYLKAVKKMRVTRKNQSTLAFIFSSKSLSQAMRRMRYLREFSEWKNRQTDEINARNTDLKNQRDALAKAKEEQSSALALQKTNKANLATQKSRQEVLIADLKKNGEALQSHLKKKQAEATELGNMVSKLIAEEQQKAAEAEARRKAEEEAARKAEEERKRQEELLAQQEKEKAAAASSTDEKSKKDNKKADKSKKKEEKTSSGSSSATGTEYADARKRTPRSQKTESGGSSASSTKTSSTGSFQDMKGKLPYPSTGSFAVTSRFGRQHLPDLPDVEYDNPGIDAETDAGSSARAVFKGKVSGVYLLPGYNTVVIVNHGNYYTVYGNISSPSVKNGDSVESGTVLGKLAVNEDDNAHSTIHFEVWRNREKLNPQEWLR